MFIASVCLLLFIHQWNWIVTFITIWRKCSFKDHFPQHYESKEAAAKSTLVNFKVRNVVTVIYV